jgi:hypothetical protein
MKILAKQILVLAVEAANPELNVLISELAGEDILVVMAEKVPQSSDEGLTYVVASYRIDAINFEYNILFEDILTLERAQVIFDELMKAD